MEKDGDEQEKKKGGAPSRQEWKNIPTDGSKIEKKKEEFSLGRWLCMKKTFWRAWMSSSISTPLSPPYFISAFSFL